MGDGEAGSGRRLRRMGLGLGIQVYKGTLLMYNDNRVQEIDLDLASSVAVTAASLLG